jgi:hypothetical protein
MGRRRRYADRIEQPFEESAPEPAPTEERDEEQEAEESPQDAALRLQRSVGNRALARMLIQRFSLPGLEELVGPIGAEAEEAERPEAGLEELAGQDPAEHVASFLELEHQLPAEARELVRQSAGIQQAGGGSGGAGARTLMGATLRTTARANLMASQTQQPTAEQLDLVDRLCDAVAEAFATWQSAAMLIGVVIAGPTAVGGQVVAPPLEPLILANGPRNNPDEQRATQTVASVTSQAMLRWSASVKAPGLPWYPSFAAVPAPIAPPTPNVPTPLMAMVSDVAAFQGLGPQAGDSPAAVAVLGALGTAFNIWTAATLVTNVLGTGPVPTFAPPYVPVGPVVGGVGNMTPGGFT